MYVSKIVGILKKDSVDLEVFAGTNMCELENKGVNSIA